MILPVFIFVTHLIAFGPSSKYDYYCEAGKLTSIYMNVKLAGWEVDWWKKSEILFKWCYFLLLKNINVNP